MEAGQSYPMLYTCLDKDGNILKTVYSPLSKEEACGEENTIALETIIEILCKNNENPENRPIKREAQ